MKKELSLNWYFHLTWVFYIWYLQMEIIKIGCYVLIMNWLLLEDEVFIQIAWFVNYFT